ncbi:MAG: sigma 54-dependent Fis family transcriptional regulator [Myxococcales bacterium]|nr:sigma 54-dependent Fis family transcriptional regulator [Myxococcales bacterium]
MVDVPTVVHPRFEDDEPESSAFLVVVDGGPDAGAQIRVDAHLPSPALVGQSEVCALRLRDRSVSRRHLSLEVTERGLRVRDLDSTNGTFIGGIRVGSVTLTGGEVIRIGDTRLEIAEVAQESQEPFPEAQAFGRMLGQSLAMRRLYPMLARIAASDIPVIVEGETGTGKEVLAEAIHEQSARADKPFVVFDCTTVPANLIEAELFGHERGAFTGAVDARPGVFELAHQGTLLIDEIGDLDLALQPKLLRAIERSQVRRVGGNDVRNVDVRILAATRRDLDHEVQQGRFRDDLFHRLAVARVELPPLCERRGDIPLLARHFWRQLGGDLEQLSPDTLARWEQDRWPGNVRELRNAVTRHLALGDTAPAAPSKRPGIARPGIPRPGSRDFIAGLLDEGIPLPLARKRLRDEFERRYVERMLEAHGGNVSKAAAASGIARRYFQQVRARTKG